MDITAVCTSCGRKFQAPDQFIGKRVKCKKCGVVFEVRDPNDPAPLHDETLDLDLAPDLDHSIADDLAADMEDNSEATHTQNRIGPRMETRMAANPNAREIPLNIPAALMGRPNTLTFTYPGAKDVDQWLPLGLLVISFLALAFAASQQETAGIGWIAFLRFLIPSLMYAALIYPITLSMIGKAGRELRYQMPPQMKLRCFAGYLPAFALTTIFWFAGGGLSIGQAFGAIIGLIISSAAIWLLFRLHEEEIATTAAYGAGGFAIGTAVSAVLLVGLNLLVGTLVVRSKAQDKVPVSPFGPGLSWASPSATPPAVAKGHPVPTPVVPARSPDVVSTPLVTVEAGQIPGPIDEIIQPLSGSSILAVVRNSSQAVVIEPWDIVNWQHERGTLQLPIRPKGKFVISPDGQRLAWIADFPRLSIQIWSFNTSTVIAKIDLDRTSGEPGLMAFVTPDLLLIRRDGSHQPAAGMNSVDAPKPAMLPPAFSHRASGPPSLFDDPATPPEVPKAAPISPAIQAVPNDAGPSQNLEMISVSALSAVNKFTVPLLVEGSPSTAGATGSSANFAISTAAERLVIAENAGGKPTLFQFDLSTGKELPRITIGELDPSLAVAPTGLAYSNDGTRLAVLLEHGGSALLLTYDSNSGQKDSEFVYPAGPLEGTPHPRFIGNAIAWLDPSPFWALYGQGLIETRTGTHVKSADFAVPNVIDQRAIDGGRIEIITAGTSGNQITTLSLDPLKLQSLAASASTSQP